MRRKGYKKRAANSYGKWEAEVVQGTSKIIKIEIQNQEINDKFKTVFYCESKKNPEGMMCVVWERTTFKAGDEIDMTGRIKDGVFLVWRHLYKPCKPKET
jgi:hypothetical protein